MPTLATGPAALAHFCDGNLPKALEGTGARPMGGRGASPFLQGCAEAPGAMAPNQHPVPDLSASLLFGGSSLSL